MADFTGYSVAEIDIVHGPASGGTANGYESISTGDITTPVVDGFSPAPGVEITPGTAVEFDVTDETGFGKIIVLVEYPSGGYEVAWDGERFAAAFVTLSTRSVIPDGFHFSVRRQAWPGSPTVRVVAIDARGNEP